MSALSDGPEDSFCSFLQDCSPLAPRFAASPYDIERCDRTYPGIDDVTMDLADQ